MCIVLRHCLSRCDNLFPLQAKVATYVNAALSHHSQIDYAVISSSKDVVNFEALDPDLNYSDHLPILATVAINYLFDDNRHLLPDTGSKRLTQRLRWDYTDRTSYYNYTGEHLSPILTKLNDLTSSDDVCSKDYIPGEVMDTAYDEIIFVLQSASSLYVPFLVKLFINFGNEELRSLKEASVESNQMWKAAGKPRQGSVFTKRQSSACNIANVLEKTKT